MRNKVLGNLIPGIVWPLRGARVTIYSLVARNIPGRAVGNAYMEPSSEQGN